MDRKMKINKPISLEHSSLKYPLPEGLLAELSQELKNINHYPSGGNYPKLSTKFAEYAGVSADNVLPANGSDEVIEAVSRAFGHQLILIPVPTFSQYEVSAIRNRFSKKLVNCLNGYDYRLNYKEHDLKEASLVWICNPNNPTGNPIPRETIIEILQRAAGIVVVDECNYEYLGETVVDLIDKYPNLVISRSFSKNFGLAGLRLGFTIANPNNIKKIARFYQHFRVNKMAEIAGINVLKYLDYYKTIWQEIARIREFFIKGLQQINIKVFPSRANFVLVDFITQENTKMVWQYLKEEGVYTFAAWGDEFSGLESHYIRFTIGNQSEMEYTLNLLKKYQNS
jgi:histidinol-phosphate aminotransferase